MREHVSSKREDDRPGVTKKEDLFISQPPSNRKSPTAYAPFVAYRDDRVRERESMPIKLHSRSLITSVLPTVYTNASRSDVVKRSGAD